MTTRKTPEEVLKELAAGKTVREGKAEFTDWLVTHEKDEFVQAQMKLHWDNTDNSELSELQLVHENTLNAINARINSPKTPRLFLKYGKVAAAILLPIVFLFSYYLISRTNTPEYFTFETQNGERTYFILPDSSSVWLNAGSKIVFTENYMEQERRVTLTGEGYFEVKSDSLVPFIVEIETGEVIAKGTVFNVKAYRDEDLHETTLLEGRISVVTADNQNFTLQPNEYLVIDKVSNEIHLGKADSEVSTSWIKNKLIFKNENMQNLSRKLERWYDVKIRFLDESIKHTTFTGTLEGESIEEVLELIKLTSDLDYSSENNSIFLYRKKN